VGPALHRPVYQLADGGRRSLDLRLRGKDQSRRPGLAAARSEWSSQWRSAHRPGSPRRASASLPSLRARAPCFRGRGGSYDGLGSGLENVGYQVPLPPPFLPCPTFSAGLRARRNPQLIRAFARKPRNFDAPAESQNSVLVDLESRGVSQRGALVKPPVCSDSPYSTRRVRSKAVH
jgi:hypothetical protein